MKITCQACMAKYTIADEKVLGKVVKIRCKKCSATIVVNGNESSAGASASIPPDAAQSADLWTVNVADGDQRPMTEAQIADAYHAGVVNDETFCWKDGLSDWLPVREIEALHSACTATRVQGPPAMSQDDVVTRIHSGPFVTGAGATTPGMSAPPPSLAAQPGGNGGAVAQAAPAPAAARRAGARAPAADLFGAAAQAGGEEDVLTSAPAGVPQVHEGAGKLTGARNENSVLFSLNALTGKGPGPGPAAAGGHVDASEASGLIDIRNLSAQLGLGDSKKKNSRVDDIMNLGGGAFVPSLSAPVLSAPPIEEVAAPAAGQAAARPGMSKPMLLAALGAGVLVLVGAIVVTVLVMSGKSDKDKIASGAESASASSSSAPPMGSGTADNPSPAATDSSASAAPPPSDSATANSPPAESATGATTAKPATTTATTTATTAATTAAATTAKPTSTTTAAPAATPAATATAAAADQPFNMGEAKARLAAIAGSVQGCKKGDTTGTGRVVVTFSPGGNVQSAAVSGPPFEGTPTGACVAARFRGAHVPAFSGSPFSVSKSFSIN
jgi:predicted Zn finger-like uncharacterized protein